MTVRRRDIGLLPAKDHHPAVYRVSIVANSRVYYLDVAAGLTETERETEIAKAIENLNGEITKP